MKITVPSRITTDSQILFFSTITGSKKRRAIQDSLRKIGALNFNMNAAANNGELITSRRPNRKYKKKATDFTTCAYCKGPYAVGST